MYIIESINGKKFKAGFLFTSEEIDNLLRSSNTADIYKIVCPITMQRERRHGRNPAASRATI